MNIKEEKQSTNEIIYINYFDNITDQSVQHVMRVLTNIVSQVKGLKEICFMFFLHFDVIPNCSEVISQVNLS